MKKLLFLSLFFLLGAGCRFIEPQKIEPVPLPPVLESPSSTSSTAPVEKEEWQQYRNKKEAYSFQYPASFTLAENTSINNIQTNTTATGTVVSVPEAFLFRSLAQARLGVYTMPGDCPTSPESQLININSLLFNKTSQEEGAAGSQYKTENYSLQQNDTCYTLTFFLHTTSPENYASGLEEATQFRLEHTQKLEKFLQQFDGVIQSFQAYKNE